MKKLLSYRRAASLVRGFNKARVLVAGDLIVDHFIWGKVTRISPEAPVPVVQVTKETVLLGGSANVVNNLRSLGAKVYATGVIGNDRDGRKLKSMLARKGIPPGGVITDSRRQTTVKTRVIAHHQQVVRFDREEKDHIAKAVMEKVLRYIEKTVKRVDVIVVSDYAKGMVTGAFADEVRRLAKRKPVIVDPKVEHFSWYKGFTAITPNNLEASRASGVDIKDDASLRKAGRILLARLGCEAILITKGEQGMSLFEEGSETHIPTVAREVFDVSGAGDTVVGTFALSVAAGADFKEAAGMSNLAAGIVVEKIGTAVVTPDELIEAAARLLK
ncbi:MAG: D-glycero-beta-D-manno-heptose-7-phosphate kinase [Deltaproteobacteria bacterium]